MVVLVAVAVEVVVVFGVGVAAVQLLPLVNTPPFINFSAGRPLADPWLEFDSNLTQGLPRVCRWSAGREV